MRVLAALDGGHVDAVLILHYTRSPSMQACAGREPRVSVQQRLQGLVGRQRGLRWDTGAAATAVHGNAAGCGSHAYTPSS